MPFFQFKGVLNYRKFHAYYILLLFNFMCSLAKRAEDRRSLFLFLTFSPNIISWYDVVQLLFIVGTRIQLFSCKQFPVKSTGEKKITLHPDAQLYVGIDSFEREFSFFQASEVHYEKKSINIQQKISGFECCYLIDITYIVK